LTTSALKAVDKFLKYIILIILAIDSRAPYLDISLTSYGDVYLTSWWI